MPEKLPARSNFTFGRGTTASPTALKLATGLTFDDWRRVVAQVLGMGTAAAWWIGDALSHGEWHYGTKYREVLAELEIEYDRIRDYVYVSGNVPPAVRRADLTWKHHRVVAKLVPKEQEQWLEQAAQEGWTYRHLVEQIAAAAAKALDQEEGGETAARAAVVELEQLRFTVPTDRVAHWRMAAERVDSTLEDWAAAVLDVAAAESVKT
jgi:hypothetical protein